MSVIDRRGFLKSSLAAAATTAFPMPALGRIRGANEDLRVACVGVHGQGQTHIAGFSNIPGVRVVALCDADAQVLDERAKFFAERKRPIDLVRDVRKLLERKDVDIITIATPNHWHALMTVWACQAGKDVYCEKPVSHNVSEGRRAVEAAARHSRIVQTGTQSRSAPGIRDAIAFVHAGKLGKSLVSRGFCYKPRGSIGRTTGDQTIPASVDYDLWTGPAALLPLRRKSLHYDWHWVWNTGNGDVGNQGIHQMDIARWALGVDRLSSRVLSVGGRYGYIDDAETPNTQVAIHEFDAPAAAAPLVFEVRGLPTDGYRGAKIGNVIECENGYVVLDTDGGKALDRDGGEICKFESHDDAGALHRANFIDAVRARDASKLNASILEGHLSSALCHTANISYQLGRTATLDETRAAVASHGQHAALAAEALERLAQHVAARFTDHAGQFGAAVDLPRVDPSAVRIALGGALAMDPASERFRDNPAADALCSRTYRAPYLLPSVAS
ncbi:MAG: Inositol 2-dehydrogenase/D-chiro-inositol 3-dehydrogenase [Phycisphaerae bacterium]|nr:Inositol 2-dehydrogenase/D-chiro-inositol 3-dehydrogenase [Phycisphaerae bacterium]